MGKLDGLFHPCGVAIIGASGDLARGGGQPVKALLELGYAGAVYPVNPKHATIGGVRCYPSVGAIEGPCDLAVIALPAAGVIDAVAACGAKGVKFAVIYGGGFREAGDEGKSRERALLAAARAGGVRLIGPNCLGVVNITDRVYAAFGSMTRTPVLPAGNVSMVYQSGGFGQSLALRCAAAGAGFRYLCASGNETDITTPELLDYYLDDAQTRIIVTYIEGVNDGRALMAAGRKAAALGKPILLWKGGRREQGLRAAASHTASMTGSYDIYQAALRQSGIIEVRDLDEVADLVQVLSTGRLPGGPRVALMGGSGGSAIVFADACDEEGLLIPALTPATVAKLHAFVPGMGSAANPIDFAAGFLADASAPKYARAVDAVLADDSIDQLCVMLATVQGKQAENGARILADAQTRFAKPILVFSSVPRDTMEAAHAIFAAAGIPVLPSPTRVAHAAAVAARYVEFIATAGTAAVDDGIVAGPGAAQRRVLNELDSTNLLASYGVPVLAQRRLQADGSVVLDGLVYPVAAKVLSRDLPHKSDVGGVRLNIGSAQALVTAIAAMTAEVRRAAPAAAIEGILVTGMVVDALELMVGIVNDSVFGPTVLLGFGGTLAEVLRDRTYRVAPFDQGTARAMIDELRGAAILQGVRGAPPRDIEALAEAVSRISRMGWTLRDTLVELDINPLFVRAAGGGVVAGDALAVVAG